MTQLNKIDENWDLFEHETKIRTYLKKLDENWDQNGILTFKKLMKFNCKQFKCKAFQFLSIVEMFHPNTR